MAFLEPALSVYSVLVGTFQVRKSSNKHCFPEMRLRRRVTCYVTCYLAINRTRCTIRLGFDPVAYLKSFRDVWPSRLEHIDRCHWGGEFVDPSTFHPGKSEIMI